MNSTIRMQQFRFTGPRPLDEVDDLAKTRPYRRGADPETLRRIAKAIAARKRARQRIQDGPMSRAMELAKTRQLQVPPREVQLLGRWIPRGYIVATAIVITVDIVMGCAALISNYVHPLM